MFKNFVLQSIVDRHICSKEINNMSFCYFAAVYY